MEVEFDPAKDAANIAKHGISLSLAADFEMDVADVQEDTTSVGERRFRAIGPIGDDLYVLIFTVRTAIRIISLRLADKREQRAFRKSLD